MAYHEMPITDAGDAISEVCRTAVQARAEHEKLGQASEDLSRLIPPTPANVRRFSPIAARHNEARTNLGQHIDYIEDEAWRARVQVAVTRHTINRIIQSFRNGIFNSPNRHLDAEAGEVEELIAVYNTAHPDRRLPTLTEELAEKASLVTVMLRSGRLSEEQLDAA